MPFLLLCMVMAVTVFLLVQTFYGVAFPISRILLSFIGWNSLGNSNWFIFVTLVSYILIAISYTLFHKQGMQAVAWCAMVLFVGLVVVLRLAGKGTYWYNTCLCVPAGMFFFLWREKIEGIIRWGRIPAWCLGMVLIPVSLLMYHLLLRQAYLTNFPAILFALGVTLLFSCISLKRSPRFLCWSGGAGLFFLYIFQRIPMMIGARAGWNADSPFFYQLFCVVVTLGIAWCTSRVFPWLIRFVIPSK